METNLYLLWEMAKLKHQDDLAAADHYRLIRQLEDKQPRSVDFWKHSIWIIGTKLVELGNWLQIRSQRNTYASH